MGILRKIPRVHWLRRLARPLVCRRTPRVSLLLGASIYPGTNTTLRQYDDTTQTYTGHSFRPSTRIFHAMPQHHKPPVTSPNGKNGHPISVFVNMAPQTLKKRGTMTLSFNLIPRHEAARLISKSRLLHLCYRHAPPRKRAGTTLTRTKTGPTVSSPNPRPT